ncbi:MAG: DDE-type integrase/transposase/recombinase [Acidobacteriota bacterium]|nr:DDE-type integrase/transposase/recombinase [Acidobacteriota bacterium]
MAIQELGLITHKFRRFGHFSGLVRYSDSSEDNRQESPPFGPFDGCAPPWRVFYGVALMIGGWLALLVRDGKWDRIAGACMVLGGSFIWLTGHVPCQRRYDRQKYDQSKDWQPESHIKNVSQKVLHSGVFAYYNNYMANVLPIDKQIAVVSSLCEGSSIRSIERITGVHRDTIMRLGVKVGQGCTALMDVKMRNLDCTRLEMDELWGYVGKKEKHVRIGDDPQLGNVWTFCAIDADTKLVPAFHVAKERDVQAATAFVSDVAGRLKNRVQISTDGLQAYVAAIEEAFGRHNVDYAQIIKTYGTEESVEAQHRYSAPKITESEKKGVFGYPDWDFISTSYVERLNATTRLHMKRLARLTHAFSKKRENFEAAVGLHFAYYNFVRRHNTLRCTPAMAAGVEQSSWNVGDLVEACA